MDTQLATIQTTTIAPSESYETDVQRVLQQTIAIQKLMESVLKDGEHFGAIPGVQVKPGEKPKKCLFKSGAEKLCLMFRMRPEYEIVSRREEPTFIAFEIRCRLYHINSGTLLGEGIGSINSRESKYFNQTSAKVCPFCGMPAIIKGKDDYGGGWLCFAKKGGCGAKFKDDDKAITEQAGRPTEAKVWELHNTMIKMAQKRALVAATLIATAASDVFTQDLEELEDAVPRTAPSHPVVSVNAEVVQPAQAPPTEDKLHDAKVRALVIAMSGAGIKSKDDVLAWLELKTGRKVESRKDLTVEEIDRLMGELAGNGKEVVA